MNKTANHIMNDKIYLRVKKAKADVESFIQSFGEITDPKEFFEQSCQTLSPDARQVIASGILFNSKEYGYQFSLPRTSDMMKFLNKRSKSYENGYSKMSVLDSRDDTNVVRVSKITRFEVGIQKPEEPKWKDLIAVSEINAGNDRNHADAIAKKLNVVFEEAFEKQLYFSIADFEDLTEFVIHYDGMDDETRSNYGWAFAPVIVARKDNRTGDYIISLPPCARI